MKVSVEGLMPAIVADVPLNTEASRSFERNQATPSRPGALVSNVRNRAKGALYQTSLSKRQMISR